MTSQRTWVALAGVGAITALVGPFDTGQELRLLPRLVYWTTLVVVTYGLGNLIHRLCEPWRFGLIFAALGTAGAVASFVLALNVMVFGYTPQLDNLMPFLATILAISVVITVTAHYLETPANGQATNEQATNGQAANEQAGDTPPALLDRLPFDRRGALVSLTAEDHYTRVRTSKGEALVLIRLSDAVNECAPTPGARVHRSHWVALAQVTAARRDGDRAILTMAHGPDIPVSRANIPQIKEAGLLPVRK